MYREREANATKQVNHFVCLLSRNAHANDMTSRHTHCDEGTDGGKTKTRTQNKREKTEENLDAGTKGKNRNCHALHSQSSDVQIQFHSFQTTQISHSGRALAKRNIGKDRD